MTLENGYKLESTFPMDFSIADAFGEEAIRDTYERAFDEWKDNYVYLTELVVTLNLKIWQHFESGNIKLAEVYNEIWEKANAYAFENLKGEELKFYYFSTV